VAVGVGVGLLAGLINGTLIARTAIPPFIATLGMMVSARGVAKWYTHGRPVSGLQDGYAALGSWIWPVFIFFLVALIFHVALRYTRYGKFTYAIGANPQAARISGINVGRHLIVVYGIAGALAGLAGVVQSARVITGQAGMGMMAELDAIAAAVIGGTSLNGGVGTISGTLIGAFVIGILRNGLNMNGVSAFSQQIIIGLVILFTVWIDQLRNRR
jgi:inositol transport system permease protein